jgi:hypothetical protein
MKSERLPRIKPKNEGNIRYLTFMAKLTIQICHPFDCQILEI